MNLERVLQRLPDISLSLDARNEVSIRRGTQSIVGGYQALPLLEIFTQPTAVSDALERLKPSLTGMQDWLLALRTIQHLYAEGVLTEPGVRASYSGFDHASLHIEMLQDKVRTSAFIDAIRNTVKPGHIVAEIGTGTGVLSVAAAQVGAMKVYAIEAGRIQGQAQTVFERNGVQDRVQLLSGWSTELKLPEMADVLVAEILGHDAFGEDVFQVFHDAINRFLKPSGVVIPACVEVYGELIYVPTSVSSKHRFESEAVLDWQRSYGIDFSSLLKDQPGISFKVDISNTVQWQRLSSPALLARVVFYPKLEQVECPQILTIPVCASGEANGLLIWFKIILDPTVSISTRPQDAVETCHWRNVVRLFATAKTVEQGQSVTLDCLDGYLAAEWAV